LIHGSMLLLPAGSPAPAGYTLIGRFALVGTAGTSPKGKIIAKTVTVDMYRRN
jgi:hypothetical protein